MLLSSVGVKEVSGDVNDFLFIPYLDKTVGICDFSNDSCLKILCFSQLHEGLCILAPYYNRHSLLGFGDGQFGTVKSFVLLGYFIQIDIKAVSQFSDGYRYSAGAEVVAADDHAGCFRISEQSLEFSLLWRVALLDLSAAGFQ